MQASISLVVVVSAFTPVLAADETVDYVRDVKPLLARRCYACHGALKQKSGLRLDTAAGARRGGKSGPTIEPGSADDSLLVAKISATTGERMPPEGESLTATEIARISAWIN